MMGHSNFDQERRQMLRRLLGLGGAVSLGSLMPASTWAASGSEANLLQLRMSSNAQTTRVVFDLDHPVKHHIFTLDTPNRVVIDFNSTRNAASLHGKNTLVKDVRHAPRNKNDLRVVLDLASDVQPSSFMLSPNSSHPHYRLVLDLAHKELTPTKSVSHDEGTLRDLVVCIDPGHGGKDPGAIGLHGTYEKNVVLPIAKDLHDRLNKQKGIKAVLTRDKDVYLHLRERTHIAHQHNADLFMSVHADAFKDRSVKGSSVYILSEHGASSEMARQLARTQNGVDPMVGNLDLSGKSEMLQSVLLDLSQTATISSSDHLATELLDHLRVKLNSRVERAAFVVLKSPDIPSVLVETAFISNPHQEKLLRTKAFQQRIAGSMHDGVMNYFKRYAPSDTLLASLNQNPTAG